MKFSDNVPDKKWQHPNLINNTILLRQILGASLLCLIQISYLTASLPSALLLLLLFWIIL
jgi:hypothetical protein